MGNKESLRGFSIEAFTSTLEEMVEKYAKVKYYRYGGGPDISRSPLLDKIISFCADALLESGGTDEVMEVIKEVLLLHRHVENEDCILMGEYRRMETLSRLSQRVAQRAVGKDKSVVAVTADEVGQKAREIMACFLRVDVSLIRW